MAIEHRRDLHEKALRTAIYRALHDPDFAAVVNKHLKSQEWDGVLRGDWVGFDGDEGPLALLRVEEGAYGDIFHQPLDYVDVSLEKDSTGYVIKKIVIE